jgi:hypothetical protein
MRSFNARTVNGYEEQADAGGNHEEAGRHHEPKWRSPMNDEPPRKETHTPFVSGHVPRANDVHEQVTNDKQSVSEHGKEATSHQ